MSILTGKEKGRPKKHLRNGLSLKRAGKTCNA